MGARVMSGLDTVTNIFKGMMRPVVSAVGTVGKYALPPVAGLSAGLDIADIAHEYDKPADQRDLTKMALKGTSALGGALSMFPPTALVGIPLSLGATAAQAYRDDPEYFKQKIKAGEIGSSAMPHKVNPIDFENAEGNLAMANAFFEFLSAKLPISRLQRDLTDSTVLRNVGTPLAHVLISLNSLQRGLSKLELNNSKIQQDLEDNWVVIAEAIQTVLRREAYPKPYEALKDLTRHHGKIDQPVFHNFIDGLAVSDAIKAELKLISPFNFVGRDEN
jgi:hypothetical protein